MAKRRLLDGFNGAILAGLFASSVGAIFYNVLPLLLGSAQDLWDLSNQQTGLIGSAFFLGYNLCTISAFFWLSKVSWRTVIVIAVIVAALTIGVIGSLESYTALIAVIVVSGAAFSLLYGIGTTIIAENPNPTRWFGIKIAAETVMGAALLIVGPLAILPFFGLQGFTVFLGLVTLSMLFFAPLVPKGAFTQDDPEALTAQGANGFIWLSLLAVTLFFAGQTEAWSFIERLAVAEGHAPRSVGTILALALVFAVGGSLSEAVVGKRLGFAKTFAISYGLFLISVFCLLKAQNIAAYAAGAWIVTLSFGFGIPLAVSLVASLDHDKKYIVLTVPAVGFGAMLGPWLAGAAADLVGFSGVLISALSLITASLFIVLFVARNGEFERKESAVIV